VSWQAAYAGIVPRHTLDAMDPQATAARWSEGGFQRLGSPSTWPSVTAAVTAPTAAECSGS
ncbi:MAG: hypothetical protein ACR2JQ_06040, partial [Mycobacteriales bacterium]